MGFSLVVFSPVVEMLGILLDAILSFSKPLPGVQNTAVPASFLSAS